MNLCFVCRGGGRDRGDVTPSDLRGGDGRRREAAQGISIVSINQRTLPYAHPRRRGRADGRLQMFELQKQAFGVITSARHLSSHYGATGEDANPGPLYELCCFLAALLLLFLLLL